MIRTVPDLLDAHWYVREQAARAAAKRIGGEARQRIDLADASSHNGYLAGWVVVMPDGSFFKSGCQRRRLKATRRELFDMLTDALARARLTQRSPLRRRICAAFAAEANHPEEP